MKSIWLLTLLILQTGCTGCSPDQGTAPSFTNSAFVEKVEYQKIELGTEDLPDGEQRIRADFVSVREQFDSSKPGHQMSALFTEHEWQALRSLSGFMKHRASTGLFTGAALTPSEGPRGLVEFPWSKLLRWPSLTPTNERAAYFPAQNPKPCPEDDGEACTIEVQKLISAAQVDQTASDRRRIYFSTRTDEARHICGSTERHILADYTGDQLLRVAEIAFDFEWNDHQHPEALRGCVEPYSCCTRFDFAEPANSPRWFTNYTVWEVTWAESKVVAVTRRQARYDQVVVHETERSNSFERRSWELATVSQ